MGNDPVGSVDPDGAYSWGGALWRNAWYGGDGIYQSGYSEDGSREVWGYNDAEGAHFGDDTRSLLRSVGIENNDVLNRAEAEAQKEIWMNPFLRNNDGIEFDAGTQFMLGDLAASGARGLLAFAEGYMSKGGAEAAAEAVVETTTQVESKVFIVTKEGVVLPKGAKIPGEFIENAHRSSNYGIMQNGKFVEKLRIDPATPAGMKGPNFSHYHLNGSGKHLTENWPWWN